MGMNLMITHSGARGDNLYVIPALNVLRKIYDEIYLCGQSYAPSALEATGLIDRFIVKPKDFATWTEEFKRNWLAFQGQDLKFDFCINLHGTVAGRLMFMKHDPKYKMPSVWKRAINKGRNYFDEMTLRFQDKLGHDLAAAIGQRPITNHTGQEPKFLREFRFVHRIPKSAFLLGWQFAGSSRHKWYPYFKQVIQEDIMQRYPEVYLVGMGDLKGELLWNEECHGGRFINLKDSISFRQAYILTSILDLLVSPETGIYVGSQAYPDVPKILLATHTDGTHITCGDESVILTPKAKCAPCYNIVHTCVIDEAANAPLCTASIYPGKVIKAIEEVIERKRRIDQLRVQPVVSISEARQALRV